MGDLTKGYTFQDGLENDCSSAHLHQLVESAAINTTFHTGKPSGGANPDLTVLEVMCYRSSDGAFVKLGAASLAGDNNTFIHGLPTKTVPAGADEMVLADSAASYTNKKLTLANLLYGGAAMTAPLGPDKIPIYDAAGSLLKVITLADLIAGGSEQTVIDGEEKIRLLTSAGVPKWTKLENIILNSAAAGATVGGEEFLIVQGATLKRLSLFDLITAASNVQTSFVGTDVLWGASAVDGEVFRATYANVRASVLGGYVQIRDQKANAGVGGTLTTGSWLPRVLNTLQFDDGTSGVTLAGDGFSARCPAGTYRFRARAPFYRTNACRIRVWNATAGQAVGDPSATNGNGNGSNGYSGAASASAVTIEASGYFTIAVQSDIQIQYRIAASSSTSDGGAASGFGDYEIFSVLDLWRIA